MLQFYCSFLKTRADLKQNSEVLCLQGPKSLSTLGKQAITALLDPDPTVVTLLPCIQESVESSLNVHGPPLMSQAQKLTKHPCPRCAPTESKEVLKCSTQGE